LLAEFPPGAKDGALWPAECVNTYVFGPLRRIRMQVMQGDRVIICARLPYMVTCEHSLAAIDGPAWRDDESMAMLTAARMTTLGAAT
jgi:hypothetical protein